MPSARRRFRGLPALTGSDLTLVMLQRAVFGAGVVFGLLPLLSTPLLFLGGSGSTPFADGTLLLICLSVMPASLLAFWFRSAAALWLGITALASGVALLFGRLYVPDHGDTSLVFAVSSMVMGSFAALAELRRWPPALQRR